MAHHRLPPGGVLNVNCPKYGAQLDVSGRAPGDRVPCASCGREHRVPSRRARKVLRILLGVAVVAMLPPLLFAVAVWTGYVRFAGRPRQNECVQNLKGWFTAQRSRPRGGALEVDTVGFHPDRGNRYAYFAGPGPIEDRSGPDERHGPDAVGHGVDLFRYTGMKPITFEQLPPEVASLAGFKGSQCPKGPDCSLTLLCAANLDGDDTLDVWSISTVDRKGPDGEMYSAGEPIPHVNDTEQ